MFLLADHASRSRNEEPVAGRFLDDHGKSRRDDDDSMLLDCGISSDLCMPCRVLRWSRSMAISRASSQITPGVTKTPPINARANADLAARKHSACKRLNLPEITGKTPKFDSREGLGPGRRRRKDEYRVL